MKNKILLCLGGCLLATGLAEAKSFYLGGGGGRYMAKRLFSRNTGAWKEKGSPKLVRYQEHNSVRGKSFKAYVVHYGGHISLGALNLSNTAGTGVFMKSKPRFSDGKYAFNFLMWDRSHVQESRGALGPVGIFDFTRTWAACWIEATPPFNRGIDAMEVDFLECAEVYSRSPYVYSAQFNVFTGIMNNYRDDRRVKRFKRVYEYTKNAWRWTEGVVWFGRNPDMRVSDVRAANRGFRTDTGWRIPLNWRSKGFNVNAYHTNVILQNRPWGYNNRGWRRCASLQVARFITP